MGDLFTLWCLLQFLPSNDFKFLSYRSSTCLVRVTLQYFMLLVAIEKGDVSLSSFSTHLSSVYKKATDFFKVNLVSCYITKSVYEF